MSARCSLIVNGKAVRVSTGDTPVEAALAEGMIAPLQALHGAGLLGQGPGVAARRTKTRRNRAEALKLATATAAPIVVAEPRRVPTANRKGTVTELSVLSPHVVQAVITLEKRIALEPGHQVSLSIEGLGPVTLCPTLRVDGSAELNEAVFHCPRDEDGTSLFESVGLDVAVRLKGPLGRGQYRPGGGRLVLVAAESGFGAIWAIAHAARYVEPAREMTLIVGARDARDLYMRESLDWLRRTGVARIVMVAERGRQRPPDVRPGPLTAHLPSLRATDVVHVAGAAATVGAVQVLAASVGARCHPIPVEDVEQT